MECLLSNLDRLKYHPMDVNTRIARLKKNKNTILIVTR